MRLGIRNKLSLTLLLVILLTVGSSAYLTRYFLIAFLDQEAIDHLSHIYTTIQQMLALRQEAAQANATTFALQREVQQALAAKNRELLLTLAQQFMHDHQLDYLLVTDMTGTVLVRAHFPAKYGDSLHDSDLVAAPLRGEIISTLVRPATLPMVIAGGTPAFEHTPPYRLLGTVATGYILDEAFLHSVKTIIGADLSLILDGSRFTTTLSGLATIPVLPPTSTAMVYSIAGQPYRILTKKLQGKDGRFLGLLEIAQSEAYFKHLLAQPARAALIAFSVLGLLIIIGSVWLANRLTRPLRQLTQAVEAFGSNQATLPLDVRSGDELATLAQAFHRMRAAVEQAQTHLRTSEERYRTLSEDVLDTSIVGMAILDQDYRIVWVNQAWEHYFGLSRQEILMEDMRQILRTRLHLVISTPETFIDSILATYEQHSYIEEIACYVTASLTRQPRWLSHWSQPIQRGMYAGGRIEHYLDITERKKTEAQIRFQVNALGQINDAVIAVDTTGRVMYWNKGAERLYKAPFTSVQGKYLREAYANAWIAPEDEKQAYAALSATGEWRGEALQKTADGDAIFVEAAISVLRDQQGEHIGFLGVIRDITARKETEKALQTMQEELLAAHHHETQRIEMELQRTRRQLVQQTQLAAIGQVSASIAHELRNPLGSIRNAAYLLQRRCPTTDSKSAEYLSIITEEVINAEHIIHNLLSMTHDRPPQKQQVLLRELVQEAYQRIRGTADISLQCSGIAEDFVVWGDPGQLRQVFENLFTNAGQAMQGKGCLTVLAQREPHEDSIRIHDTGPGVPANMREQIFEPLFTTKAKGTGLGLTICRQLVINHGGSLSCEARNDSGSEFVLRLPHAPVS